jgi:microcystin-dependent protein
MGALARNFQGTPQELADAIAAQLRIVTQQSLVLFASGITAPSSDVGPWYNTNTEPGQWYGWNSVTGAYEPLPLSDIALTYILSVSEPDPNVYQLWIKLDPSGKGVGVYTYYAGAWHDVYEDAFIAISAAIDAVVPPTGPSGQVLTSTGPATDPVWLDVFLPGMIIDYAGTTVPAGQWLLCDGSLKNIVTYPALFTDIGSTYGGDGITTFAVPDLRGRVRVGVGTGDAPGATPWGAGQKRGEETHTLTTAEIPVHQHTLTQLGKANADGNDTGSDEGLVSQGPGAAGSISRSTDEAGSGQPHDNLQPSIGINALIRY